jgi:hypothetical protein
MTGLKPFLPNEARDALPEGAEGDFLLPVCMPYFELLVGEDLAVVVLNTAEGQRIGVPMGLQSLYDLKETISEALRMLQAPVNGETD